MKKMLLLLVLSSPLFGQTIKSCTPKNVLQNSPQLNITITGSGFKGNQKVMLGSLQLSRTMVSKNQIVATVPAWMMTVPAFYALKVGNSNSIQFQVCPPIVMPKGPLPQPVVGVPYSYQLIASGGCQPNP